MENRFGFIHNDTELKVLILYVLGRISVPVPREELTDLVLLTDNGIGYFEFSDCLADLIRTEHVAESEDGFVITPKGAENGKNMESSLPYSVRIRAEKAAVALDNSLNRAGMIKTSHTLRQRGGFSVNLALGDGEGDLINMELLCGDDKTAKVIEDNFRKNAERIYGKIIELLTEE